MFSNCSPQKRKNSEFHDPDYQCVDDQSPVLNTPAKRFRSDKIASNLTNQSTEDKNRLQRICNIITKEFEREIGYKEQQLKQIDDTLAQARRLLKRLRHSVVADYYCKNERIPTPMEVSSVRGNSTLFDHEHLGPQIAMHPSIKKIIGKRPCTYEEILRACPTRTAAENAKHTIRMKTQAQKRKDRLTQQLIREQGIVIDHSKGGTENANESKTIVRKNPTHSRNTSDANENKIIDNKATVASSFATSREPFVLNATRLNNKTKCLIVIGNTSQYIHPDTDTQERRQLRKLLSYKWIVYVQSKDKTIRLEHIVRKVRFFLHHSYRPNDVIDVTEPPFQIACRGWGEFPMRIQLFFRNELNQKSVQLIHNLVLDKSCSGLHTMGAETLVEIWLRTDLLALDGDCPKSERKSNIALLQTDLRKPRAISFTHNKDELEDNLFDFFNKIEEAPVHFSADIEKIQPTFMIPEAQAHSPGKSERSSPKKRNAEKGQSMKKLETMSPEVLEPTPATKLNTMLESTINIASPPKEVPKLAKVESSAKPAVRLPIAHAKPVVINIATTATTATTSSIGSLVRIGGPNSKNQNNLSALVNNNNNHTIAVSKAVTATSSANPIQPPGTTSVKILQKKLVQLVDANGKTKYLQMLVASNSVNKVLPKITITTKVNTTKNEDVNVNQSTNSVASHLGNTQNIAMQPTENCTPTPSKTSAIASAPIVPSTAAVTTSTAPTNTQLVSSTYSAGNLVSSKVAAASKNVVFQREGKLYIIDPLQMRLKQEQKKQVSLLKPQVALLKQNKSQQKGQQLQRNNCVQSDHDYVPTPHSASTLTQTPAPSVKSTTTTTTSMLPVISSTRPISIELKSSKKLLDLQRTHFEQKFLIQNFTSINAAVDYLLPRLSLVANKENVAASAFSFISKSFEEFNELDALKQKACEWLRAKYIGAMLSKHKGLQQIASTSQDALWNTSEILMYARHHAYTPWMQAFCAKSRDGNNTQKLSDIVKSELDNEQKLHYNTLTTHCHITQWVDNMRHKLQQYEAEADDNEIIDVVGINVETPKSSSSASCSKYLSKEPSSCEQGIILPTLEYLQHEVDLVKNICKDIGVHLDVEKIGDGMVHPMAQTVLAKCIQMFIGKMLRKAVASKMLHNVKDGDNRVWDGSDISISLQDLGRTIAQCGEFDFLTNRYFGIARERVEQNIE